MRLGSWWLQLISCVDEFNEECRRLVAVHTEHLKFFFQANKGYRQWQETSSVSFSHGTSTLQALICTASPVEKTFLDSRVLGWTQVHCKILLWCYFFRKDSLWDQIVCGIDDNQFSRNCSLKEISHQWESTWSIPGSWNCN